MIAHVLWNLEKMVSPKYGYALDYVQHAIQEISGDSKISPIPKKVLWIMANVLPNFFAAIFTLWFLQISFRSSCIFSFSPFLWVLDNFAEAWIICQLTKIACIKCYACEQHTITFNRAYHYHLQWLKFRRNAPYPFVESKFLYDHSLRSIIFIYLYTSHMCAMLKVQHLQR